MFSIYYICWGIVKNMAGYYDKLGWKEIWLETISASVFCGLGDFYFLLHL